MNNIYNKIILYDDKNLMYCTGSLYTKLKLRILENQLNREYNNTGRSNI